MIVFETATRSGDRIAQLAGTGRKFATYLNGGNTAEITVPLGRYQRYEVDPGAVELQVRRDGELVWVGPVWGARADTRSGTLTVTAAGLDSYFEGQRLKTTLSYSAIDQATIWRALLNQDAAAWNITVPVPTPTGVTRTYAGEEALFAHQRIDLAQKVDELSALTDGFDWSIGPDRVARLHYPHQGVVSEQVLELGRNLDHIEVEVSARGVETVVDAFGSGEGTAMPSVSVEAPAEILRYGRRHGVTSDKKATSTAVLRTRAAGRLARRARASEVPRLVMLPGVEPTFGQVSLGDTVEVRASLGWVHLMADYRIGGIEVDVDDSGMETVSYLVLDPTAVESEEV